MCKNHTEMEQVLPTVFQKRMEYLRWSVKGSRTDSPCAQHGIFLPYGCSSSAAHSEQKIKFTWFPCMNCWNMTLYWALLLSSPLWRI